MLWLLFYPRKSDISIVRLRSQTNSLTSFSTRHCVSSAVVLGFDPQHGGLILTGERNVLGVISTLAPVIGACDPGIFCYGAGIRRRKISVVA